MAPSSAAPLLTVQDLSVSYGHVNALKDASLEVREGEIVVLIGANGAGKTTLLETVLGINLPVTGTITFDGQAIGGVNADRNVRAGLCLVPEGRGVFSSMNVIDNLLLGAHHNMRNVTKNLRRVFDWFPILEKRRDQVARTLSGGERQMLAIGRALMAAPKLIMVDEPSIGLAPNLVERMFQQVREVCKSHAMTAVLVEQNVSAAMNIADRVIIMNNGQIVFDGNPDEARASNFWHYF